MKNTDKKVAWYITRKVYNPWFNGTTENTEIRALTHNVVTQKVRSEIHQAMGSVYVSAVGPVLKTRSLLR